MKTPNQIDSPSRADELLRHVWNHIHGVNMDGKLRKIGAMPSELACERNWQKLSDAIGEYLGEDEE